MKFSATFVSLTVFGGALAAPVTDVASLEKRQFSWPGLGGGSSGGNNDVTGNTGCKAVTLIFARGTGETGTMGNIVGPGLASALKTATGSAAIQGLSYPASAAGNANGGASGGPDMAKLAAQAIKQCPDTKVILGGYSQGAMVVHNAMGNSAIPAGKIAAVVAFGDPFNNQGFKGLDNSKIVRYCGTADSVCAFGGVKNTAGSHLSYGNNVKEAASKLAAIVGVQA